jgi:tetratricopeptide (TPR) repeat protein
MKKIFLLLIILTGFMGAWSQSNYNNPAAPVALAGLTAADWQSDLKYLQQTVHSEYPFLFKKVTAKEFDAEVEKLYLQIPKLQNHERIAGIARLVSLFKYGHTTMAWWEIPVKYRVVPVNFYWFSDGIFVEGTDKKNESLVGAKLLKVEGKPVSATLVAIRPLVPAENDQFFKANGLDFLTMPEALHAQGICTQLKNSVTFTFQKDGKTFDHTLPAMEGVDIPRQYGFVNTGKDWISVRDQSTRPLYLKNLDKIYYYEYLPQSKTVYVRHSQIQDEKEESTSVFYKKIFEFIEKNDVERLVLDVRLNGGGNNYKNKPIVTGIIECRKINQPGKLFVITGRRTFSACQNLVNELHNYTRAVFVGEPTAENINFYGDTRRVELPKSKIPVMLSFAWWQDKPQWENDDWLAPNVAVDMSFEAYKTNQDPALDTCLAFSDKDLVLDPMGRLSELFTAGKLVELESEAMQMVNNPKYRYIKFEQQINQAAYKLMRSNQMEAALYVFELNTKLYPRSANVCVGFAEANQKAGKKDRAIEYYNKAIALDPNGRTGDHARSMLEQMNSKK